MTHKMISVGMPQDMLPRIDEIARRERRSRSAVIREAVRRYLSADPSRVIPLDEPEADEIEAVRRGREEFVRGDFVKLEDLQRELGFSSE